MKQKIKTDKTELQKSIIYKLWDKDNDDVEPQYFTQASLKFYVAETLWEAFENDGHKEQPFAKMEVFEDTEYLFAYLEYWNYAVQRIIINSFNRI